MKVGNLLLRERSFEVRSAKVRLSKGLWSIEIETVKDEFDGENWSPYLYHQGLRLSASSGRSLSGLKVAWHVPFEAGYPHPETGVMYVFGHHEVRDCIVEFGDYKAGQIQLSWRGLCDIFWDDPFNTDVPFNCSCVASVADG